MEQRVMRLLAAAVAGGVIAAGVTVVLIGFAPAYLEPRNDDARNCGRGPDRDSLALVQVLADAGFPELFSERLRETASNRRTPSLRLQAVRCGSGVEAGPVPLLPTARQTWLAVLDTTLAEDVPSAVEGSAAEQLDDFAARHASLRAEQRGLTLEAVTLAQDVDLAEVLTAAPEEVSPELRRLTTAVFADLADAQAEMDEIDAEIARVTRQATDTTVFAATARVVPPTSPYGPIALFSVLGAGLATSLLLWHEQRTSGATPSAGSRSDAQQAGITARVR